MITMYVSSLVMDVPEIQGLREYAESREFAVKLGRWGYPDRQESKDQMATQVKT